MDTGIQLRLKMDCAELMRDLERIEDGELELPTVSAVKVEVDGFFKEDVPLWLDGQ